MCARTAARKSAVPAEGKARPRKESRRSRHCLNGLNVIDTVPLGPMGQHEIASRVVTQRADGKPIHIWRLTNHVGRPEPPLPLTIVHNDRLSPGIEHRHILVPSPSTSWRSTDASSNGRTSLIHSRLSRNIPGPFPLAMPIAFRGSPRTTKMLFPSDAVDART